MRAIMAVVYAMAGVLHLVVPDKFMLIVPDWVPFRRETILLTGLCELAGSVALLFRPTARLAGVMLALYAVCVYPRTSSMRSRAFTCRVFRTDGGTTARDSRCNRSSCGGHSSAPAWSTGPRACADGIAA